MGTKRKRDSLAHSSSNHKHKKQEANENVTTEHKSPEFSPFVENPTGDELKREVTLYEKLASEDELERLAAADTIVSGLLDGNGVPQATLLRHLERRLFRGLASGRKGARLGYSVVLTEIISQLYGKEKTLAQSKYTGLHFQELFRILKLKTKPEGDLNGQELKDHVFGLLFGLQCFVRSRVLLLDTERWRTVLLEIFDLAKRKPWIREECGWMVVEALEQMDQTQAEITLVILCDQGLSKSPEGVGIWITARNRFPSINFESLPKVWGQSADPLDHLQRLSKVLNESSGPQEDTDGEGKPRQANQTGNWNAKLHFVWRLILDQYTGEIRAGNEKCKANFTKLWTITVDETLFASTASRERKFWGFLLFQEIMRNAQIFSSAISTIFSPNLLRCLINHSQDKDRFLHRAAERSLKVATNAVQLNPHILPDVLQGLVGRNGIYRFDSITKSKTVSQMLASATKENIDSVVGLLEDLVIDIKVVNEESKIKEAESRRQMLGEYLLQIIKKPVTVKDTSVKIIRVKALQTIAKFAYCNIEQANPTISGKTRELFRSRLMSSFAYLLTDLEQYSYACDLWKSIEPSAVEMDSGIKNANKNADSKLSRILKKIKKADSDKKTSLQAIALLYSVTIFQLYNGEPEAVSCLNELDLCYQNLVRKKAEISETQTPEVLIELLLSLVSKQSLLLRKVTQFVFGAFLTHITEGCLELMTNVLAVSESLHGQQELFDQEEYEEDEEDDDEQDNESLEILDKKVNQNSLDLIPAEQKNIDSDDETSDSDEEEIQRLNAALATTLGTNLDASESEDAGDMTDSEMMALDSKLVEIFSQRQSASKSKTKKLNREAKANVTNFKSRVLELLETYVKKKADCDLAFNLILPLLRLFRTTKTRALAEKAHSILHSFSKAYRSLQTVPTPNPTERLALLGQIHDEAATDPSHAFCKASSTASLIVVSSLYRLDSKFVADVANIYRDTQVKWIMGQAKTQALFFTEWINWCQSHLAHTTTSVD